MTESLFGTAEGAGWDIESARKDLAGRLDDLRDRLLVDAREQLGYEPKVAPRELRHRGVARGGPFEGARCSRERGPVDLCTLAPQLFQRLFHEAAGSLAELVFAHTRPRGSDR